MFNACKTMKPTYEYNVVSVLDSMDELVEGSCEEAVPQTLVD